MLQLIRDRFTGVVAFLIIGAIAVTLVISFGNMRQGGVSGSFAATVNGEEIDMRTYQRAVQNQLARQQEALKGGVSEALQEQIQRNVLEGLVRNRIMTQYVRDKGYRVDDRRLATAIGNQSVFQVGGSFSRESYVAVLASQGLSPEFYESSQRAQMEVRQLEDAIVFSSFYTPSEFRRYIELLAEEREVSIVELDPADLAGDIKVEEDDLQAYYDANPDEFTTPESVSLEYVEIRLDDIAARIKVDEQEVREYYDAHADQYVSDEQRQARHILIAIDDDTDEDAARKLAGEIRQRIVDGEKFEDLAREYSDDPVSGAKGGELGWASRGDYDEAFETALFGLQQGEISEPVRTQFGYHIIRLDAIKPGSQLSYAEVHDELVAELKKQKAADRFYALAEQVDDLALENPMSLDPVASETGLKVRKIEQFTRNGGPPFGYNAAMVEAAFSTAVLEDGENSPLIEMPDDSAIILRVAEHHPSVLQPLAEVRDRVEASERLKKASDTARERGEKILARVKAGESLEAVAAGLGIEVRHPGALMRTSNELGAELLAAIFRAPRPAANAGVYRGIFLANGGYAVFRLEKVEAGRAAGIPQDMRDQRKQMLAQQSGRGAIFALIDDLRQKAEVTIAPGLFDKPETF